MGVKRISRGKLLDTEKLGQDVDIDTGVAMKNAVVSATQHREGYKLITDIVLDLGTSKATILTGGATAARPCGESSGLARICKITEAAFGIVTEIRVICLEQEATNGTDYTDSLDISIGSAGTGTQGAATDSPAAISTLEDIGAAVGVDITKEYQTKTDLDTKSLYIGAGSNAGTKVAGTATVSGIPAHGAISTVANGSRLVLYNEAGAKFELIIDKTVAYNATAAVNKIHLGSVGSQDNVDQGFKAGIEATNSDFSVTKNGDGTITIAAKSGSGAEGNNESHGNDNSYTAAAGETAVIAVTNFTGGTTQGLTSANADAAFTAGKFLIRLEGFVAPDDL
jgi:hypothetical protein